MPALAALPLEVRVRVANSLATALHGAVIGGAGLHFWRSGLWADNAIYPYSDGLDHAFAISSGFAIYDMAFMVPVRGF